MPPYGESWLCGPNVLDSYRLRGRSLCGAHKKELPHFNRNDIAPLMTLLKGVQPPQERDKLVRADKLDPQRRSICTDIDVNHVGHFNRAHHFARRDGNVECVCLFIEPKLHCCFTYFHMAVMMKVWGPCGPSPRSSYTTRSVAEPNVFSAIMFPCDP